MSSPTSPWQWKLIDIDEFTAQIGGDNRALSAIRHYHGPLLEQLSRVPGAAVCIKARNERVRDRYTAESAGCCRTAGT